MSIWKEPGTSRRHITVKILLPSVFGAGYFTAPVIWEGDILELSVAWPKPLFYVDDSPRMTPVSLIFIQVISFLTQLCRTFERTSKTMWHPTESVAQIGPLFSAQTYIEIKHNLAYRDNLWRVMYLSSKDVDENYAMVNGCTKIEFVWLFFSSCLLLKIKCSFDKSSNPLYQV